MARHYGPLAGGGLPMRASAPPKNEICAPANLNSPEQTVISGHAAAGIKRAVEIASQLGAKTRGNVDCERPFFIARS